MTERISAPRKLPGWIYGGLFGCMVIISWMGWNTYRPATEEERARLVKSIGGEDALNAIENAETVYATRIQLKGKPPSWTTDDFEAISEPVRVGEAERHELKKLLSSPRNYHLPDPKGLKVVPACMPNWGFRLSFVAEDQTRDVWVCLECRHMLFVNDGREVGGLFYSRMKEDIAALAVRLFPGDQAIAEAARN